MNLFSKYIIIYLLFIISYGYPVVLHPETEPDETWANRPSNKVTARVGSCSAAIIHPQYILYVSHCPNSSSILIDGQYYTYEKTYTHPLTDMRLIKVANADFDEYAPIPEWNIIEEEVNSNEDWTMVVGGYGKTRGNLVFAPYDPNLVVGYTWGSSYGNLKWGTNEIYGYNWKVIYTKFGSPYSTSYECGLATYDSGCGAFLFREGIWWTVGLGQKVGDAGYDYFLHPILEGSNYETLNIFIRTYPMKGWIESIIYGADMNRDGVVDSLDLSLFVEDWLIDENPEHPDIASYYYYYNSRADLNQDGVVNNLDWSIFSSSWLKTY